MWGTNRSFVKYTLNWIIKMFLSDLMIFWFFSILYRNFTRLIHPSPWYICMFKVYNDWTKEKILYLSKAQCNCLTPTSNVISAAICIANICRNNIRKDDICLQGDVNNLLFIFVVNYYAVISRQRKQNTWICNMAHINDQVIIRPRYLPMLITFDFPLISFMVCKHPLVLQSENGIRISNHCKN